MAITYGDQGGNGTNGTTFNITIPATVSVGDGLLIPWVATNATGITQNALGGNWVQVGSTLDAATNRTSLWAKVAEPGDAGSTVALTCSALNRHHARIATYPGVDPAGFIDAVASRAESVSGTTHAVPTVNTVAPGCVQVIIITERSSTVTTNWVPPAGYTERSEGQTSGTGGTDAETADNLTPVAAGTLIGGGTYTGGATSSAAVTTWVVSLKPAPTSQSVAVGLTTETDTAQAVARAKSRAAGQPAETGTSQPVARSKRRAEGLSTETDTAQAVGRRKSRAVGLNSDAESALTVTRSKRVTLGLATETDASLALVDSQQAQLGMAAETDTAPAVTRRKNRAAGQPAESGSALAVTRSKSRSVALTGQTDLAFPLVSSKRRTLGIAVDTATALPAGRGKARSIGLATETDTALALSIGDGSTTTPPRHTGITEYALAGVTAPRNTGTTPPR